MKTSQFIRNNLHNTDGKQRTCSSVFTDGSGDFYSYGYHYKLIAKINGKFYINDAGYSVTTAKHIGWAHKATDYSAFVYNAKYGHTPESAAIAELKEVNDKLATIRKNAFVKKANLEYRKAQLEKTVSSFNQ